MRERPSVRACGIFADKTGGLLFAYVLTLLTILSVFSFPACAGETSFETRYSTIVFNDESDLFEFGKRLGGTGSVVSRSNPNLKAHIRESVDRIVFRVKVLLDMHPEAMRFTVHLHAAETGLAEAYRGTGAMGDPPIAFYTHKSRTIHMGLRSATDRVFAHEVAHAVINTYFSVPPPPQVQEILAQYVDKHLWEN